jgi:hypothetical protein
MCTNSTVQVWDYMMLAEQFAESSPLLREQVRILQ